MKHQEANGDNPLEAFLSEEEVAAPIRPAGTIRSVPATLPGTEPEGPGAHDPRLILAGAVVLGAVVLSLFVLGPATPAPGVAPLNTLEARALVAPGGITVSPVRRGAIAVSVPVGEARGTSGVLGNTPARPPVRAAVTSLIGSIETPTADPAANSGLSLEATRLIPGAEAAVAHAVTIPAENDRAVVNAALGTDAPAVAASTAASAINPSATATAAIRHTLDQYRQSYNTLDATAVSMIWIGLDTRALQRAFSSLGSQDLAFDRCDVSLAPGSMRATAQCAGVLNYVRKVGSGEEHQRKMAWTIGLVRTGDRWLIERVVAR